MKMEQTECSETSAYEIQTPGNYPEESIQNLEHGESLKSRMLQDVPFMAVRKAGTEYSTGVISKGLFTREKCFMLLINDNEIIFSSCMK
jgi:hypothetical protein